jgi:hypothetical protein
VIAVLVALITALALIAWKALDNHARRQAREHEVRIADVYRVASESVRKREADVHAVASAQASVMTRLQRVEEWQQIKSREGFANRGRG